MGLSERRESVSASPSISRRNEIVCSCSVPFYTLHIFSTSLIMLALDSTSYFLFSKYCIPHFLANGGGTIINIGATRRQQSKPGTVASAAAKGAIESMTRAMACEYAERNITVNTICPGIIRTPVLEKTYEEAGLCAYRVP